MIPNLKWWQHLYRSIRWGEWSIGWERYEGKPKLLLTADYYDGYCWCLLIGPFWLNAMHY